MRASTPAQGYTSFWLRVAVFAVLALSAASVVFPKVAMPAAFLTLVCFLSFPRTLPRGEARWLGLVVAVAGGASAAGMVRFVVTEAVPGIIQGGKDYAAKNAVSRMREIVFAEDAMRTHAALDRDGDHIGSAALIAELSGRLPLRNGQTFTPILNENFRKLVETRAGAAAQVGGYLYMVCLPRAQGGFTAKPNEPIDEELAERRFLIYAWPAAPSGRIESAFFSDEHERILVSKNEDGKDPRYVGPDFPPDCGVALANPNEWQTWMNKKPRLTLPGDGASPNGPP